MRLAFALTLTVLAGGCASTEPPLTTVGLRDVDQPKMDAVEEAAARRGVRVYWMNPPLKPEASIKK
jgi:uncharacterized lipoprotein YmbA